MHTFTDQASQALQFAAAESRALNHPYTGSEHILLGLIRVSTSRGAQILENLGVTLSETRRAVEAIFGVGAGPLHDHDFSARAKEAIALAIDAARQLNQPAVDTAHLLLGLTHVPGGAAAVLGFIGVSVERVRAEALRALHD